MANNDVFYEADENFDDAIDETDRDDCDTAIGDQIFARSKCKVWATKTRNVCTNFRNRTMLTPQGEGAVPALKPSAGHQALKTAQTSLTDMTKYFRKLDSCSTKIIVLHGYRFLVVGYATDTAEPQRLLDTAKSAALLAEAQVFIDAYQAELTGMQDLIDKLEFKLHTNANASAEDSTQKKTGKQNQALWRENRMFKPHETLSTKTSPADIDYWAESMETYADSSGISKAPFHTQHAFMRTCVDETFWHTIKETLRDDAPLFPPNRLDRGGESVLEKLREAHAVHNPIAANRLILFTRHQATSQPFEEYQSDMLWVYNRCNVATLTDVKLLSYLIFMGIRDDDLKEAIVTEVKGDDTKITVELMVEVAKTRTTFHVYKNLVTKKESNIVGYTNQSPKPNQRGNGGAGNSGQAGGTTGEVPPPNPMHAIKGLTGDAKKLAMQKAGLCLNCGKKGAVCKQNNKCSAKSFKCKLCDTRGHFSNTCLRSPSAKKVTQRSVDLPNEQSSIEGDANEESD